MSSQHRRFLKPPIVLLFGGLALAGFAQAETENWPHWRGPRFDGTSQATGLAQSWSRTENVAWRLELPGAAASTPAIWDDRLFLTSTVEASDDLLVLAVSRDGKELWRRKVGSDAYEFPGGAAQFAQETNPASPSPVTDGKHVFTLFGSADLVAHDFAGQEAWRVNLEERYGKFQYYFGLSSSPFLHGDRLYVQVLNTNSQLVLAIDKAAGQEIWKHERTTDAKAESLHSYASPFVLSAGGRDLLLVHGADYVTGHGLGDGAELWRHGAINPKDNYNSTLRIVATPVYAEGLLVVPTAKRGPVYGLKLEGASGDITGGPKHRAWQLERGTPDVPSPLVHDGLVYLAGERGTLTCLDAKSGETLYEERVHQSTHRASPVLADGMIFMAATDGTVSVIRAGRNYELLAKNTLDERLAASPAISGHTIYLRSSAALYAIRPSD